MDGGWKSSEMVSGMKRRKKKKKKIMQKGGKKERKERVEKFHQAAASFSEDEGKKR